MKYIVEVLVSPYSGDFRIVDEEFMDGRRHIKPIDFDIRLGVYLLDIEHVPPELLEPVKKWVREHPTVTTHAEKP